MVIRLLIAFALLVAWAVSVRAISLSARTERLIDQLEQLRVVIDRLERCGPGGERAAYSMSLTVSVYCMGCAIGQGFGWMF